MKKYRKSFTAKYLRSILEYNPHSGLWTWRKEIARQCKVGLIAGSLSKIGYRNIGIHRHQYRAARLAYLFMIGRWPNKAIDHKDGNPSNDKWSNLRLASDSQNMWNRKGNSRKLKGAFREHGKYRAIICYKNKLIGLGLFQTEQQAHRAYIKAAKHHFGEFARAS